MYKSYPINGTMEFTVLMLLQLRCRVISGVLYQLSGLTEIFNLQSGDTIIGREISRYFATRGQNEPQLRLIVRRHKGSRIESAPCYRSIPLGKKQHLRFSSIPACSIDFCKRFWIYGVVRYGESPICDSVSISHLFSDIHSVFHRYLFVIFALLYIAVFRFVIKYK